MLKMLVYFLFYLFLIVASSLKAVSADSEYPKDTVIQTIKGTLVLTSPLSFYPRFSLTLALLEKG